MRSPKVLWIFVLAGAFFDLAAVTAPILVMFVGSFCILTDRPCPSWWVIQFMALFALISGIRAHAFRDMWTHMRDINLRLTKELKKDNPSN